MINTVEGKTNKSFPSSKGIARINEFNKSCPLVAKADTLSQQRPITGADSKGASVYYGLNISPYKEPAEQFDPVLLVNFWNKILKATDSDFQWNLVAFIAGKYRLLNLRQTQNPITACAQWERDEQNKKETFSAAFSSLKMGYSNAITTDELWQKEAYWDILCSLVDRKDSMPNGRSFANLDELVFFGDIPKQLLGQITVQQRNKLAGFKACQLYLYAELAEAYVLKNTYNTTVKIGPKTEEEYDQYLRNNGFSIVQIKNPLDLASPEKNPVELIPYIGQKGQNRFWGKDSKNPEFEKNVLARLESISEFDGGPLDQWRSRIALWKAACEEEFADIVSGLSDKKKLADAAAGYIKAIFGTA